MRTSRGVSTAANRRPRCRSPARGRGPAGQCRGRRSSGPPEPELVVDQGHGHVDPGADEEPEQLHHPAAALDGKLGGVDEGDPECPQARHGNRRPGIPPFAGGRLEDAKGVDRQAQVHRWPDS